MTVARPEALLAGVALTAAGAVSFLAVLGMISFAVVGPLLLIAVGGVLLLLGLRSPPATADVAPVVLPVEDATEGLLRLQHGAGRLNVGGGARAGMLLEGTANTEVAWTVRRDGALLEATMTPSGEWLRRLPGDAPIEWDLTLAPDLPLGLEVRTGASRVRLDLSAVRVHTLTIHAGAADVDLTLPARGRCTVSVTAGAAAVRIRVPHGVAGRVSNRTALTGVAIDQARFPRSGDGYSSPEFAAAENAADISLDGGLGSFTVL